MEDNTIIEKKDIELGNQDDSLAEIHKSLIEEEDYYDDYYSNNPFKD